MCIYRFNLLICLHTLETVNQGIQLVFVICNTDWCRNCLCLSKADRPQKCILLFYELLQFISCFVRKRNICSGNLLFCSVWFLHRENISIYLTLHVWLYCRNWFSGEVHTVDLRIKIKMIHEIYGKSKVNNRCHSNHSTNYNFNHFTGLFWALLFLPFSSSMRLFLFFIKERIIKNFFLIRIECFCIFTA